LFEIFVEPAFALTVFTVKGTEGTTRKVFEKIEKDAKMFPSSAVVGGTFVIRVVSGLPGLSEKDMQEAFEIIVQATEEVKHLARLETTGDNESVYSSSNTS
jgi:aromatic-L-amino-acid decarboxylase